MRGHSSSSTSRPAWRSLAAIRVASSRIANAVRNKLSGEKISDAGCTYRAFKRECIENLKFFKGMHRFLPTLLRRWMALIAITTTTSC